jgi:hypothetical protein
MSNWEDMIFCKEVGPQKKALGGRDRKGNAKRENGCGR